MSESASSSSPFGCRRRVRLRILPSESEPSDSSPVVARERKSRKRVVSQSTDTGSEVEVRKRRRKTRDAKPVIVSDLEFDAESVGDETICPVCLGKMFETTLQGRPDSCAHTFCLDCITEWSKNSSTCVVCRSRMTKIKVIFQGEELEELPVKKVSPNFEETIPVLDPTLCVICQTPDREAMLFCEMCDTLFHHACLNLPLILPKERWKCLVCSSLNYSEDHKSDETYVPHGFSANCSSRARPLERSQRYPRSARRATVREETVGRPMRRCRKRKNNVI